MAKIYAAKSPAITKREIDNLALSRELAGECAVLLENDGALPLSPCKVALYGNGARLTVRGGTGSGDVNTRSSVSIEQGLTNAGFEVVTKDWIDRQDAAHVAAREAHEQWIRDEAERTGSASFSIAFSHHFEYPAPTAIAPADTPAADAAVYVVSRTSGEGCDRFEKRGDYYLYEEERDQIRALAAAYEKLIVILNVGGVMDTEELRAIPGVNAILLMGQLGSAGGDALADVLTGAVTPSGKLTDTWAKKYGDNPAAATFSHNDGQIDDEYYTEGIYVGYRYFDSFGVEPAYPFGFGRSYTTFELGVSRVRVEGDRITVSVAVKNTGARSGKEVAQVYVSAPAGKLPKPRQELVAFVKTNELAPGGSETVEATFPAAAMASYCQASAAWVLEPGEYVIRVGASSADTVPAAVLTLERLVKTEQLRNLFSDADPVQEIDAPAARAEAIDAAVPRLVLDPDAISTHTAVYSGERQPYTTDKTERLTAADVKAGRCTVEELTAQLSVQEMAELCVGTRRQGGSIIGDSSKQVPGAAGDTSSVIMDSRGVKNMILADGPAGLRLQPVFKTDKAGRILPGGKQLGGVTLAYDPAYTEENSDTWYQYCTAIPIGWSLAQSWNMPLLERVGDLVGGEMELFGVDLWLAPALNIHRDPLCGRNFEYFSEDPVISGQCAAAITRGVQHRPGKGTTIKHFAANSQEDNRYFTNSHISERALREIYLRNFEICVREGRPLSLMTSYNKVNGVWSHYNYDLATTVLRGEWGYDGAVMTDWWMQRSKSPEFPALRDNAYRVRAQVDVLMPGSMSHLAKRYRSDGTLLRTLGKPGGITRAELRRGARNVLRLCLRLAERKTADAGEGDGRR